MKRWDASRDGAIYEDILNLQGDTLPIYALESYAIIVDNQMQNQLLRELVLSHAEIARELELAFERIQESEARLNEAQQIAQLGRWDIDHATKTRNWTQSLYRILEIDPSTPPTAELFLSRVHPDDAGFAASLYEVLKEKKESWTVRYRLLMPGGQVKWVFFRINSEFDAAGNIVHSYGTIQDITAMKEAEDKLELYSKHLEEMVAEQVQQTTDAQMATIYALVKLSESRNDDTGAHIERTAGYCRLLAQKARELPAFADQIDEEFISTIYRASPLHDIGKVGISDSILLKPGKLTPEEFAIMKTHVEIGYQTLKNVEKRHQNNAFIRMGLDITRYHHEKWDGSGYLSGHKGTQIPLSARIMTLADVYDALRSRRVYKDPYPHETSMAILAEGRGTQFDPALLDLFVAYDKEFEALYDSFS